MNPISDAVIEKNKVMIEGITDTYVLLGIPAFIRIETGISNRNLISPMLGMRMKLHPDACEEYFNNTFNPVRLIKYLTEKKELYLEAYSKIKPGQAIIAIDWEAKGIRELFDPIIFTTSQFS